MHACMRIIIHFAWGLRRVRSELLVHGYEAGNCDDPWQVIFHCYCCYSLGLDACDKVDRLVLVGYEKEKTPNINLGERERYKCGLSATTIMIIRIFEYPMSMCCNARRRHSCVSINVASLMLLLTHRSMPCDLIYLPGSISAASSCMPIVNIATGCWLAFLYIKYMSTRTPIRALPLEMEWWGSLSCDLDVVKIPYSPQSWHRSRATFVKKVKHNCS